MDRPWWMQAGDLKFLEYLRRHEDELIGPATIAKNNERTNGESYNRDYVWRRLQDLEEAGLVEKPSRGDYRITDLGIEYLEGNVPAEELDIKESRDD